MGKGEHEQYIRQAYDLARQAVSNGDHPFGALLLLDGQVLLTAVNTVYTDDDQTRHAETNLVAEARRRFGRQQLARCVLYTSTEPCAMCSGAIYAAQIPAIVYGCGAETLAAMVHSNMAIPSRAVLALGKNTTAVTGPVLEEEGIAIHQAYWDEAAEAW